MAWICGGLSYLADSEDLPIREILVPCLILFGMLIVGTVGVTVLRKWLGRKDNAPAGGFSFNDLRQMHRDGKLTDAEFERVRARLGGKLARGGGGQGPGKGPMEGDGGNRGR
jgi:hypothetical protein